MIRVSIGEARAVGGEGIDMRRGHVLAAVDAYIGVAQIVGKDENDVRSIGGGFAKRD